MNNRFLKVVVLVLAAVLSLGTLTASAARSIEVWAFSSVNDLQQLIPQFEKSTKVTVHLVAYTSRNDRNTALQQLMAGRGPDVVIGNLGDPELYSSLNRLVERWNQWRFITSKFALRDEATGNIYALPTGIRINGIAIFKPAFTNSGLDPNRPPASWEDLAQTAAKLTKTTSLGRQAGFECAWDINVVEDFLTQNNGRVVSEDGRRSLLNSQPAKQTLAFLAQLFQTSRDYQHEYWGNHRYNFPLEAPMSMGNSSQARALAGIGQAGNVHGAFAPKRCTNCSIAPPASATGYIGIARTAKNSQDAWNFITWFLSPEISAAYNAGSYNLPPRLDAANQVAKAQPLLVDWYKLLPNARIVSYSGRGYEVLGAAFSSRDVESMFRKVLRGEIDSAVLLDQLHYQYQEALDAAWAAERLR
ncbi:MAG TPA: extracellular solute-binding protein [Firmicutes bacterium]|nr:extracellular solute-binding protein [Bacillota bacterium]